MKYASHWNDCRRGVLLNLAVLVSVGCTEASMAAQPAKGRVLARVNGVAVTQDEVRQAAASDLKKLRLTRLQYEAKHKQKVHDAVESNLNRMVGLKLVEQEAERRSLPVQELLRQEVSAGLKEPTDQEVAGFYQSNRKKLKKSLEQMSGEIRRYLSRQRYQKRYQAFVDRLKAASRVESFLEPNRVEIRTLSSPSLGPVDAPITLVEFSDFQCPYCARLAPVVKRIAGEYPGQVRLVFRQFPLRSIHAHAQKAAEASLCAFDQGRFWEMHDALFAEIKKLEPEDLTARAKKLNLDLEAFNQCLHSGKYAAAVQQDLEDGMAAGVSGTPAVYINGRVLKGSKPYDGIKKVIEEELQRAGNRSPR